MPEVEASPTQSALEKTVEEAEKLEQVRRSPESSPTQQLAQMAAEAGPSTLGGTSQEEAPTYCGRQGSPEGIPKSW